MYSKRWFCLSYVLLYYYAVDGAGLSGPNVCPDDKENKCCYNYYPVGNECKECPNGTYGAECHSECNDGYYGRFCKNKCKCDLKDCNKTHGCTHNAINKENKRQDSNQSRDKDSYQEKKGLPADINTSTVQIQQDNQIKHSSDQASVIVAIFSSIIAVVLIIVSVILIMRRKLHKTEETKGRKRTPTLTISGIYDEISDADPTSVDKNRGSYAFLEEEKENENQGEDYEHLKRKSKVRFDLKRKQLSNKKEDSKELKLDGRVPSVYDKPPPLPKERNPVEIQGEENYQTPRARQKSCILDKDTSTSPKTESENGTDSIQISN